MTDIINLPQDIFPDKESLSESIIVYDYSAPAGSFKGRSILHKNVISLVLQGEKKMSFSEKTVRANEEGFHFLSSGNCLVSMDLKSQTPFKSILIFFDDTVLAGFYLKFNKILASLKRLERGNPELYLSFPKDEFVNTYISSLKQLLESKRIISPEMALIKFEELMLYLVEKYPEAILSFQKPSVNNTDEFKFIKTIEANISNNLSLDELSFLCNTSVSTFKRKFARIYGTSPNKWLLRRRMEIAAQLLKNNNEKPSEIYFKVGYENHSSFTQSFKQIFGFTPKEYQLQQKNIH